MLAYIYQVVLLSAVLYAYYHFFLRNEKFHIYNRFYLMGILVLSLVVPLVDIPVYFNPQEEKIYESFGVMQTVIVSAPSNTASTSSYANLLTICYILICSFLFIRLAVSIIKLIILKRSNPFYKIDGILFIETNHNQAPFSFFRWLFWKQDISVESPKGQQIFEHEWYHIYHKHSWDIIFSEIVTILFWFNPIFYLIKNEIKSIQEFLADQYAVSHSDITGYAELLLLQAFQTQKHPLVNPFFNNQLKRRITMLTKSKKPTYQYFRKIMILPLVAMSILLFSFSYSAIHNNNATSSVNNFSNHQRADADTIKPDFDKMLILLDGKIVDSSELKRLSAYETASVNVLKSVKAIEKYGKQAEYGAIEIISKGNTVNNDQRSYEENANAKKKVVVTGYEIFTKTETDASYPGGANVWRDYLSKNLDLSFTKSKNIPAGNYTTIVQFIVDRDGTISDLKALTKLGYGFEEEAIRVIKKSGKWIPAMQSNKLVAAYRKQPITFQILK